MKKKGLSQETLKLIACVSMLIDHIGAVLLPQYAVLRAIGRIAFPIYCFLLAQGAHYTKNAGRYCLRLVIGMLLSELPFDYAFYGGATIYAQSVMVTLTLGFIALWLMGKTQKWYWKLCIAAPFVLAADLLQTDYGGPGVMLIVLFSLLSGTPIWVQSFGVFCVLGIMSSATVSMLGFRFPLELLGVLSMVPIGLYSGRKATSSRAVQWAFYLFYPVHLTILYFLK